MRYGMIAGLALLLTGCAEMRAREAAQERAAVAANNAADDAQCRGYGAAPGSPAYVQCRTQLGVQRRNQEAAAEASERPIVCNRVFQTTVCN